jgi:hypothetical protein
VPDDDWEQRLAELWTTLEDRPVEEFVARIDELTAELPDDDGAGPFERAAARDSTGHSDLAVPLYRQALDQGRTGERRRRAVSQLASSLRNTGEPAAGVELLETELARTSDALDDAVRAFLALALVDSGREREAVSHALIALARHLPRYQRSTVSYARALVEEQ